MSVGVRSSVGAKLRSELDRSPVATIGAFISAITVIGGGLAAVAVPPIRTTFSHLNVVDLRLPGVFFFVLVVSLLAAASSYRIFRISGVAGFFVSIVLASFTVLMCGWIAVRLGFPLDVASQPKVAAMKSLIIWGVAIVFFAVNAEPTARSIADLHLKDDDEKSSDGVLAAIVISLVIWAIAYSNAAAWCLTVSA